MTSTTGQCRIPGCTGTATHTTLCLYHTFRPDAVPDAVPAGERTCPHCQHLCTSPHGLTVHIGIRHPDTTLRQRTGP